jgi:hypothetical protein
MDVSKSTQRLLELCRAANIQDQFWLGSTNHWMMQSELTADTTLANSSSSIADSGKSCPLLFWCPGQVPLGKPVFVASSRLTRKLEQYSNWFDAIRTLAVRLDPQSNYWISASGTTTHPYIKRAAELFGMPFVQFEPFPNRPTTSWLSENAVSKTTVFYQPIQPGDTIRKDHLLISIAETVFLLSVKKGGNVESASISRLNKSNSGATHLLINRKLTSPKVESSLLANGATAWWLYENESHIEVESNESREPKEPKAIDKSVVSSSNLETEDIDAQVSDAGNNPALRRNIQIQFPKNASVLPEDDTRSDAIRLSLDEIKSENYLIHWTRRRVGAWPDQHQSEYIDDLIFQTRRHKHHELASLCRILASKRLYASNDLTRDSRPVVCFSSVPINRLLDQRVFRPHIARWDFEPYGIAIDRSYLESLGARPVIYGDETTWKELPEVDRPFFQLAKSTSKKIDWTNEAEWRLPGDLHLQNVPHDCAFVFVHQENESDVIASLTHWPVLVLDQDLY